MSQLRYIWHKQSQSIRPARIRAEWVQGHGVQMVARLAGLARSIRVTPEEVYLSRVACICAAIERMERRLIGLRDLPELGPTYIESESTATQIVIDRLQAQLDGLLKDAA